jgi:hypothetical protein
MTSFLVRLTERHAAAPVIRPRVLSRFERPTAAALPAPMDATEDAAVPLPAVAERTTATRRHSPAVALDAANVPHERDARREAVRNIGADDTHAALPLAAVAIDARVPRDAAAGVRAMPTPRVPDDGPDAASTRGGFAPVAPARSAAPQVVATTRHAVAPVVATRRDVVTRSHGASAPVVREPDVIRVHIGRVEIRTVMPPAARPQPRAAAPAPAAAPLPLDRYLDARSRS